MNATFNTKAILATALLAGVIGVVGAFEIHKPVSEIQTVVIHHQRMTQEQKIAFDTENSLPQTVIISAARLNEQQKMQMAIEDQSAQLVIFHNKTSAGPGNI
ncbi:hypothetical protein EJG51_017540 [Undibacterium piscinae]|uniref:Uncharacterized protein n=1 Tax=Undibacterium piscinae TaxID=2495591 RepID=A0A6M4AC18_9BURK|nr:hypothetical protein EJG51_017540 [Undibacterium piscinae]